jgi:phosphoadenylyl-sulfate reductase (thioredoxin)
MQERVQEIEPVEAGVPVAEVAALGDEASAGEVLAWAAERFAGRLAIFTSFQAEGMVIVDLAQRLGLSVPILTLDTGRLPQETYDHWDRIRRHYGVEIRGIAPDAAEVAAMVRRHGPNHFRLSVENRLECCRVRKVAPFRRAVAGFDAWISGVRREQGESRRDAAVVEPDLANDPEGRLFKVSPLAIWTLREVWEYLRDHRVPTHPLYERGYHSIGCAPCSRPLRPGEDPRASRWWWERTEHRECGLHLAAAGEAEG